MPDELPNTEQMLRDLSKIEGLDLMWNMLAMALSIDAAGIITKEEAAIIRNKANATKTKEP